jgi:hypothetical protein
LRQFGIAQGRWFPTGEERIASAGMGWRGGAERQQDQKKAGKMAESEQRVASAPGHGRSQY